MGWSIIKFFSEIAYSDSLASEEIKISRKEATVNLPPDELSWDLLTTFAHEHRNEIEYEGKVFRFQFQKGMTKAHDGLS